MGSMDSDARWQQIAALRDEVDEPAVVVPICVSRLDGKAARTLAEGDAVRRGAVVLGRLVADRDAQRSRRLAGLSASPSSVGAVMRF